MKVCSKCREEKPYSAFRKRKASSDGCDYWCKECHKTSEKVYHSTPAYKVAKRKEHLKARYNITIDEYEEMFIAQDGRCGICHREPRKYALCVDHEHKTGRIRGLLCIRCNRGLGMLGDSLERVKSAIEYLKKDEEF